MRMFSRIVERRSFTRAAHDLDLLPRTTATDAIKALEARVGVRLLRGTTRQVKPPLEGELFYGRRLRLIAEVEDAERRLPRRAARRPAAHRSSSRKVTSAKSRCPRAGG